MPKIRLSGPTLFAPLLDQFKTYTAQLESERVYQILMIITDGVINDMGPTIDKLVQLSSLPCSIIIVGVGDADFSNMEELDADDVVLYDTKGRKAVRDIV